MNYWYELVTFEETYEFTYMNSDTPTIYITKKWSETGIQLGIKHGEYTYKQLMVVGLSFLALFPYAEQTTAVV